MLHVVADHTLDEAGQSPRVQPTVELAWDTTQAAAALNLSVTWLEQLRLKGSGPRYVKIGRRVLYRPADISAWLEANLRQSTSSEPCNG